MVQEAAAHSLKVLAVMSLPLFVGLGLGIPTGVIREMLLVMIGIGVISPCAFMGLKFVLFTALLYMGVVKENDASDVGRNVYDERMERVLQKASATGTLPPGWRLFLFFGLGEVAYAITVVAALCFNVYLLWGSA